MFGAREGTRPLRRVTTEESLRTEKLDKARSVARALPGIDSPRWRGFSARRPPPCVSHLGHPRRPVDVGPLEPAPLLQERYGVCFAVVLSGEALVEAEAGLAGDLTRIAFRRRTKQTKKGIRSCQDQRNVQSSLEKDK